MNLINTWNRWDGGTGSGGNDDVASGKNFAIDLNFIRRKDFSLSRVTVHSQAGIALNAVVWFDSLNHVLNPFHHLSKIDFVFDIFQAKCLMFFEEGDYLSTAD